MRNSIKTLKTNLIVDADLFITAELLKVKGNFATILFERQVKRCKIYVNHEGVQYIYPDGRYSMAPAFYL